MFKQPPLASAVSAVGPCPTILLLGVVGWCDGAG